jgi:hypothetical protein
MRSISLLAAAIFIFFAANGITAQNTVSNANTERHPQEVSESDGVPVLIKHLPQWEQVRDGAKLIYGQDELIGFFGDRPVFDLIDFRGGTEAVGAVYPQGKLLIVEFTNPQGSMETDAAVKERLASLAGQAPIFYRRIGNYNAFVFDAPDEAAANELLDQIKYEKIVQWLGEDPYLLGRMERYFATTTRDIFIATVLWIVLGLTSSILLGIAAGFVFYRVRENKRASRSAYSDAGGLTRLNLDGLSE